MPYPIRTLFSVPYGAAFGAMRAGGKRRHQGLDLHCPIGTPIYGTEEGGRVEFIGYNGDPWMGLGHNIRIRYPSGVTVDAHMSYRSPLNVGDRVGPFTLVGRVGLSGNAINADPEGPHVHHERRNNRGLLVNPATAYGTMLAGGTGTELKVDDMPTMNEFLNYPAWDGGPTISEALKAQGEVYKGLYRGGDSTPGKRPLMDVIGDLHTRTAVEVWQGSNVIRDGAPVPVIQELADAKTIAMRQEASIAALTALLAKSQGGGGVTLEQIRQAVDEAISAGLDGLTATVTIEQP